MILIDICVVHIHFISWNKIILFFQNKRLAFALKKEDIEVAEKCLSLGADVNYMEEPQGLYMVSSIVIVNSLKNIFCHLSLF